MPDLGEPHRQRRRLDFLGLQRLGVDGVADAVADIDALQPDQRHNGRQVDAAKVGHVTTDRRIDRIEDALKAVPNLRHQRLPRVQHVEADQPAHHEMGKDKDPGDRDQQQQDVNNFQYTGVVILALIMIQWQKR